MLKSSMAFSRNTVSPVQYAICAEMGPHKMRFGSKYLGLPLILPRSKVKAFQELKDKVCLKLAGWKTKVLS